MCGQNTLRFVTMASFCIDEMDTEMFIESVKCQPVIWNTASEEYKDKRKRDAAWEEVGKNLFDGFAKEDDTTKCVIAKKLTAKWRNIRDNYAKSQKKKPRSGQPAVKARQYIYSKQLSFLQKIISSQQTSTLSPQESIVKEEEESSSSSPPETSEEINVEEPKSSTSLYTPAVKKKAALAQGRSELESALLKYINTTISMEAPDEDQSFFDSLLPSVRKLNENQKLDFRAKVIQALKDIKQNGLQ